MTQSSHKFHIEKVGIPPIVFLYTLDQIAAMVNVSQTVLVDKYLYFHLRSTGRRLRHQMTAVNIAPDGKAADWRVDMKEFARWLYRMGIKVGPIIEVDDVV